MIDRYGAVKLSTIRQDIERHRTAVRSHDSEATEATWLRCERWTGCIEALSVEDHRMIAAWHAVLKEVTDDLEAEIRDRHQGDHPVTLRKLAQDMITVDAARAALAEMERRLGR